MEDLIPIPVTLPVHFLYPDLFRPRLLYNSFFLFFYHPSKPAMIFFSIFVMSDLIVGDLLIERGVAGSASAVEVASLYLRL